jgi:hypothetical protein
MNAGKAITPISLIQKQKGPDVFPLTGFTIHAG